MIKVDNLDNLFWDNGTWKFPNTYPKLIGGKFLENVTPVMTSPIMGWIILTGNYNYAEYNGELFFLKKDILISSSKNKWRYVLIKDHLCTIFKNKANVIAKGTLIQTDVKHLQAIDIQFTFPSFNLFAKRILLPVTAQAYRWKEHLIPIPPSKKFSNWRTLSHQQFNRFIQTLEQNKRSFEGKSLRELLQGNEYITLLGKTQATIKEDNWKNDLVKRIKDFLKVLKEEPTIRSGKVDNVTRTRIVGRHCITHTDSGLCSTFDNPDTAEQIMQVDLSGLEDIKHISWTGGLEITPKLKSFGFKWKYTPESVGEIEEEARIVDRYVKKLARRVRISFLNPYSTRAIYHQDSSGFSTWYWKRTSDDSFFYPQKVFLKVSNPLIAKEKYERDFPAVRKNASYRSVYLYWCYNLDFLFYFKSVGRVKPIQIFHDSYWKGEFDSSKDFIDPKKYFEDTKDIRRQLSTELTYSEGEGIISVAKDYYDSEYPWSKEDFNINIGWLIGQVSPHIRQNKSLLHKKYPFLISNACTSLWRIKGFNASKVQTLIQNTDAYQDKEEDEDSLSYNKNTIFTLDLFNTLPARARQNTLEEDFLIGEKLLVTTWGPVAYLLFQPGTEWTDQSGTAVWYKYSRLDGPNSRGADVLFSKYVRTDQNWTYPYAFFDMGDDRYALTEWGKGWFKKAYEDFATLEYKPFYRNSDNFATLQTHIENNTQAYFQTESINFKGTPIEKLAVGDVFFSDLEWFWFDDGFTSKFISHGRGDWFNHSPDSSVRLEDGDVIVFSKPESNELHLGKVSVFEDEVTLPSDQYITQQEQIDTAWTDNQKIQVRYTKISHIARGSYSDWDSLIADCQAKSEELFGDLIDVRLTDLRNLEYGLLPNAEYLFDLVGTPFYCYLDKKDKVSLIWKSLELEQRDISKPRKVIYSTNPDPEIANLTKVQQVNQRVDLSIYGNKLEMPCRAIGNKSIATIDIEQAYVADRTPNELMDAYKVEVKHALGRMYFRLDVPRDHSRELSHKNYFAIEGLNAYNHRAVEDYLLERRQFAIGMDALRQAHNARRVEHKAFAAGKWIDAVLGVAMGSASIMNQISVKQPTTKMVLTDIGRAYEAAGGHFRHRSVPSGTLPGSISAFPQSFSSWFNDWDLNPPAYWGSDAPNFWEQWGMGDANKLARYKSLFREKTSYGPGYLLKRGLKPLLPLNHGGQSLGIGLKAIADLAYHADRGGIMESQIATSLEQKALESYRIDLGFERQKENHLMNLKQQFAQYAFQGTTSRERNKLLDALEKKPLGQSEVYIEVWTTSEEQERYVNDYHLKHGVDCRVPDQMYSIKNGIEEGIYCIEDVEILNLKDRIDHLFLKTRLQVGIKFVAWEEHEKADELIPVDPRITKLQQALKLAERTQIQLEQDKRIQSERISALIEEANRNKDMTAIKEADLANLRQSVDTLKKDVESRDKHIESDAKRYHELAESYTETQKELKEARSIQALYRGQTTQLKRAIEDAQHKLQEETNKAVLYKNEADHLKQDLLKESSEHASIKEEHSSTKEELEKKTQENATLTRQIDTQIQNIQQLQTEKQRMLSELEIEKSAHSEVKQQLQAKDGQIQELTSENERLKSELQTRPTDTEVRGCQTSILELPKLVKYILIGCGANYRRTVISNFHENTKTWINNKNKKVVRDASAKQVKILDFKTPIKGTPFDNVVKTYAHYRELLDQKYTWLGGQEFNTNSAQIESGIPFFETPPRSKTDKLGCERWFKDGQWYHKEVEGATKITNYGEYLDALGLVFENGKAITIKEKLTEVEESLTAVRAIEAEKDKEIAELKARPVANLFQEWSYNFWQWNMELISSGAGDDGPKTVILNPLYLVINKGFDYEIIKFDPDIKAFLVARRETDDSRYRIFRYPAYNIFTIGPLSNREEDTINDVWKGYVSSYFTEVQTTWAQIDSRKIRYDCASAVKGTVRFLHVTAAIPYFEIKGLIKTIERAGDSEEEEEAVWKIIDGRMIFTYYKLANFKPIYWDPKWRNFTYTQDSKHTKINNFKDYKRVLNITETEFKTPEGINIIETEEDYQKLIKQGALSI